MRDYVLDFEMSELAEQMAKHNQQREDSPSVLVRERIVWEHCQSLLQYCLRMEQRVRDLEQQVQYLTPSEED